MPKLFNESQIKGLTTELICMQKFIEYGFIVSVPYGNNSRYDLLIDCGNNQYYRIQCKTATWAKDTIEQDVAFEIRTYCTSTNTKRNIRHKYSVDEIDYFYTWFNGQGYLVSIQEANGTNFRWRYEYPPTGQKQGIHIADEYKIEEVIYSLMV